MKLVIDIPEQIYKELTETAIIVTDAYPSTIEKALTEGTPYEELKSDEWCTGCKEYDTEKHCCPRFNRVIRETLNETSKPKGKWILWEDCEGKTRTCTCPICGDETRCWHAPNYCSNCGVRLEVEE